MSTFWPVEIPITLFLQNLGTWIKPIMSAFSFLGNEMFFLLVMTGLYWAINSSLGLRVGFALLSTTSLNSWLKLIFRGARPYWFDDRVTAFSHEPSFGFPSGHSQSAVTVWGRIAHGLKKVWFWILAIFIILGIGLSRIYLGVHFTSDVLGGWLIGVVFLVIFILLEKPFTKWWQKRRFSSQVIIAFGISIAFIAISIALLAGLTKWTMPEIWKSVEKTNLMQQHQIVEAELDRELYLSEFEGAFSNAGILWGMIVGASMLHHLGGFTVAKKWQHKILSYLLGLAGVLVLYFGLKLILPDAFSYGNLMLRYLRYALLGLWISLFAPLIFIKLKWASSERD